MNVGENVTIRVRDARNASVFASGVEIGRAHV